MNVDNIVDKMYNEMLKRCGVTECAENAVQDNFDDTHKNLLEEPKMSSETKSEQSGYGKDVPFERIRRCTGYLSGDYKSRFNDAKRAEVEDRINSNKYTRTESYHERGNKK